MFDFGFTEILVAAVIGLIVIGPERLPRVHLGDYLEKCKDMFPI